MIAKMNSIILQEFDNDVWNLEKFNISESRHNKSNYRKTFSFQDINNGNNKILVKKYIASLISNSTLSVSTIYTILSRIKTFSIYLNDTEITNICREDVLEFYNHLENTDIIPKTYNSYIYENYRFMQYMEINGLINVNHFYTQDTKTAPIEHVFKKVEQDVIDRLFEIIDKLPFQYSLIFLILYCTGMRISEACQLKVGCTSNDVDGYFIQFYIQKMKKFGTNPIPKSLYDMIKTQEKIVKDTCDEKEIYLFPREFQKPYLSTTFRNKFNEFIEPYEIITAKGDPYRFRPHDYRHTLASYMAKTGIPAHVVQAILHHESQQMTMAYIDRDDKERIEQFKEFVDIKGLRAPISIETAQAEWLRANINAQLLPNGLCALPTKLGKCPHANSCLTCKNFRTSVRYLSIHKEQLRKTKDLIEVSKNNGWEQQVATNILIYENLTTIINKLEEGDIVD